MFPGKSSLLSKSSEKWSKFYPPPRNHKPEDTSVLEVWKFSSKKETNIAPQELSQNCSLLASCISLTGYWYEPGYIIHVKQTLAVTNCFTRNKIVYLLQNREQKELKILIWKKGNGSIGNIRATIKEKK